MKSIKLFMLFTALFLIFACEDSPTELDTSSMGSIRGYVHKHAQLQNQAGECFLGQYPYVNAKVKLLGTGISTRTDKDGRFQLDQIGEGTYTLVVDVPFLFYIPTITVNMYNGFTSKNVGKILVKWSSDCESCP